MKSILALALAIPLLASAQTPETPSCVVRMPSGFVRTHSSDTTNPWFKEAEAVVNFKRMNMASRSYTNIYIFTETTILLNYKSEERAKEVLAWAESKMKECQ